MWLFMKTKFKKSNFEFQTIILKAWRNIKKISIKKELMTLGKVLK